MLKVTETNKLTPSVISTLIYLQSLVGDGEQISLHITEDEISVITEDKEFIDPIILKGEHVSNPIKNIITHINEDMCTDCLTQEWQFKNPYFINLVGGYVNSLVHTYGLNVPIPYELASAILKWDITDYDVVAKKGDHRHAILSCKLLEAQKAAGYTFFLNAK